MKKLLVMGSNFGSVPIVKRAKERGIYTIVADYYDSSRSNAKLYCDECWDISITETDLLAEKCREENVDAVTCGVSEFTSEYTFRLCDALGLPKYCTWEAWSFARNKRAFKDMCKKCGVHVADDYHIDDPSDPAQIDSIVFPVVVKPIDCGGNAGMTFCDSKEELVQAFELARSVTERKDTIICERLLNGKEYASAYALAEGEASLIDFFTMHYENGAPTNCYSVDVTSTGVLQEYLAETDACIKKVFKEAGFTDGLVWVEYIYDEDGLFYALEPGYRLPGGMIPYTFEKVRGFNAIDWYLDCFLGIKHSVDDLPESQTEEYEPYGISYMFWNSQGGVIKSVNGLDRIQEDDRFDIVDFIRRPGYELKPYSLMGEVLFTADSKEKAVEAIEFINDTVSIINDEDEDVLVRFTCFDKIY